MRNGQARDGRVHAATCTKATVTEGVETVTFGLDGTAYEIDACERAPRRSCATPSRRTSARRAGPAAAASAPGRRSSRPSGRAAAASAGARPRGGPAHPRVGPRERPHGQRARSPVLERARGLPRGALAARAHRSPSRCTRDGLRRCSPAGSCRQGERRPFAAGVRRRGTGTVAGRLHLSYRLTRQNPPAPPVARPSPIPSPDGVGRAGLVCEGRRQTSSSAP